MFSCFERLSSKIVENKPREPVFGRAGVSNTVEDFRLGSCGIPRYCDLWRRMAAREDRGGLEELMTHGTTTLVGLAEPLPVGLPVEKGRLGFGGLA